MVGETGPVFVAFADRGGEFPGCGRRGRLRPAVLRAPGEFRQRCRGVDRLEPHEHLPPPAAGPHDERHLPPGRQRAEHIFERVDGADRPPGERHDLVVIP